MTTISPVVVLARSLQSAPEPGAATAPVGVIASPHARAQNGRRAGFTLVEMLVVIAIIAILAAILLPVFSVAREHARRNACISNLQKIGAALQLYEKDQGGYPPDLWSGGEGLKLLCLGTPKYLGGIEDLHCPDNPITDSTNFSSTTTSGYDNYDGVDEYGAVKYGDNSVATDKYSLIRLPSNDFSIPVCGVTEDFANPDYTRQLRFAQPDPDTVVTWCTEHRPRVGGIPTPTLYSKDDLVLFVDGKVLAKQYEQFGYASALPCPAVGLHPILGNGLMPE